MAKKKNQNIVITDKELTPTIIGKLDTKQKSPILLVFIFIIFIAVAIFLPDINGYIEDYLYGKNDNIKVNSNTSHNDEKEENPVEGEEITYYDYTDGLIIPGEIFNIYNIVKTDTTISFEISNNTDAELKLDDLKYYLEIYSSDTTLLQRIKISYGTIAAGSSSTYTYDLDDSISVSMAKLLVAEKSVDDYPEIILNTNDEGNGILTCTKGYDTLTYTFGNDYLINISDIVNYPFSNDVSYTTNLQSYQVMSATYNNYEGVSSTLINNETGFTFTTLIDLRNADIKDLDNKNYYDYRTISKIVKFETESNGYSCS